MKSIEVLALGIRVIGIFSILEILQFTATSYAAIQQWAYVNPGESITAWLVLYGCIGLLLIAVCFLLIKFPITVSRLLLPNANDDEPVFNGSADDLRISAFIIIGVYILSWAIPDFIYNASMLLRMRSEGILHLYNQSTKGEIIIQEIITVLEIVIGLYLCLQAKGLNTLLLKFRGLGAK